MEKAETLQEFYKRKFAEVPGTFTGEIGHFNLFRLEPLVEGKPTTIPYRRRDFYKIMLVKGQSEVHFQIRKFRINGNTWIKSGKAFIAYSINSYFINTVS